MPEDNCVAQEPNEETPLVAPAPTFPKWRSGKVSKLESYYKFQESLNRRYEEDRETLKLLDESGGHQLLQHKLARKAKFDTYLSIAQCILNIAFMIVMIATWVESRSYAILATAVIATIDVIIGFILWAVAKTLEAPNYENYPLGRYLLEPLAVILMGAAMSAANLLVITESIRSLIEGRLDHHIAISHIIAIMVAVFFKIVLWILCHIHRTPYALLLATDQRNDVITYCVALLCASIGERYWIYLDPVGAIVCGFGVILIWCVASCRQMPFITGRRADQKTTNRIINIALEEGSSCIKSIQNVAVYHYGLNYLVELSLCFTEGTSLAQANGSCRQLGKILEALPYVVKAFIWCHSEEEATK